MIVETSNLINDITKFSRTSSAARQLHTVPSTEILKRTFRTHSSHNLHIFLIQQRRIYVVVALMAVAATTAAELVSSAHKFMAMAATPINSERHLYERSSRVEQSIGSVDRMCVKSITCTRRMIMRRNAIVAARPPPSACSPVSLCHNSNRCHLSNG